LCPGSSPDICGVLTRPSVRSVSLPRPPMQLLPCPGPGRHVGAGTGNFMYRWRGPRIWDYVLVGGRSSDALSEVCQRFRRGGVSSPSRSPSSSMSLLPPTPPSRCVVPRHPTLQRMMTVAGSRHEKTRNPCWFG
jgi:hypothetical protein